MKLSVQLNNLRGISFRAIKSETTLHSVERWTMFSAPYLFILHVQVLNFIIIHRKQNKFCRSSEMGLVGTRKRKGTSYVECICGYRLGKDMRAKSQ